MLRSARMSRALRALAAVAILASGCASRGAVGQLESDVGKLRAELAEMRVAQEVTARDLARATPQLQALDARTSRAESGVTALADEVASLNKRADAANTTLGETRARVDALAPPAATPPPATAVERPRVPPAPAPTVPTVPPAPSTPSTTPPSLAPPMPSVAPAPSVVPPRPAPRAGNPETEYATALATFRSREHGQAVLDFIDFIAKYPKHPLTGNAQYWIGEAYWVQRDYRQALLEFEKVFEHGQAKAPDALVKIGLCYVRLRDLPRAQQAWQRVVSKYPKSEAATMAQSLLVTHAVRR